jgi:predicted RNA-binding Zn-ribbon protein involved in translation (DUF1610 family)
MAKPDAARTMTGQFVTLSCSNCGRQLDVYDGMDQFACGYCGTDVVVQRHGRRQVLARAGTRKVPAAKISPKPGEMRADEGKQKVIKPREARPDDKFRRAKWGFGIGGGLLLIGFVVSKTVKKLKPAPVRDVALPPALVSRVETLRSVLAEVSPMTREQWLNRLRRDLNPEKEVLWWERVAECFMTFTAKRTLSPNQKQSAFKVIFGLCSGLTEQDLLGDVAKLPKSDLTELATTVRLLAK